MSSYLSTLMWSFLPGRIAQTILPTLSSTFPHLLPPAPPGTEAWRHNYRRVLTAVVILALAYNSFSVMRAADVDWYDLLGVGPRAGDDELRRAFRQLSRVYHPDRLGPNPPPNAEAHFIAIRQAYETLTDPVKQYAYDRFGPSIASWQKVDGMREYILRGAQSSAGFYIGTIGFMLVLALLGRAQQGAYWRNMLLGVLLMYEATLILTPTPEPGAPLSSEPILAVLPKWVASTVAVFIPTSWLQRPAYQHIALLHRLFTDISIAISQLAAEWSPQSNTQQQVLSLSGIVNSQAVAALSEEIGPVFASTNDPAAAERNLLDRIEALHLAELMEHHPAVAPAWNEVMGREIGRFTRAPAANAQANGQDAAEDGAVRPRAVRGSTPRTRRRTPGATPAPADGTEALAAATNTPLPPSPPSTPLGGARRRSARLGAL